MVYDVRRIYSMPSDKFQNSKIGWRLCWIFFLKCGGLCLYLHMIPNVLAGKEWAHSQDSGPFVLETGTVEFFFSF